MMADVPNQGLPPGSRVAGYLIERRLGAGGMAVVYLATDERLNRKVALKVLAPELAQDVAFRLRFIRESRVAASVDDPHIIPVFEAGESDNALFIAMRYVPGGDVHSHVRESGPLPRGRAALILSQVASALDSAHRRDLVHRDVKPANMLMDVSTGGDRPDHIYLSDFGISKAVMSGSALTGTGVLVGTLDYMAPEQIEGEPVDGRADQYSLACAAYELLSGAPPFTRDQPMAMIWAHVRDEVPALTSRRPDLPSQVDAVLGRALAKSPADRYATCRDFTAALREALRLPQYESGPSAIGDQAARTPTQAVLPPPSHAERPPPPTPPAPVQPAAVQPAVMPAAPVQPGQVQPGQLQPGQVQVPGYAPGYLPPPGYGPAQVTPYAPYPYLTPTGSGAGYRPDPAAGRARRRSALAVAGAIVVAAGIVAGSLLVSANGKKHNPGGGAKITAAPPSASPVRTTQPTSFTRFRTLRPAGKNAGVSTLAFSDSGTLATAGNNGTVYLWNPATGQESGSVAIPGQVPVLALAFSPDGKTLAIGDSAGSVYLWHPAGHAQPVQLMPVSGRAVESIAFNPSGTTVAAGDGSGDVRLWSVAARKLTGEFSDPASTGVNTLAFSPDGHTLATGDYNGTAYLWQVPAATQISSLPVPGSGVLAVQFSPDGRTLATGSFNGSTYLWNVSTGSLTATLTDPNASPAVEALAFSPDGSLLATGDVSGYTYLWRLSDDQAIQALPSPGNVWAVGFSHDGSLLAVGDHHGATYVWKG
jgi:serine/threonine protein kinase/WD40 repeat protein